MDDDCAEKLLELLHSEKNINKIIGQTKISKSKLTIVIDLTFDDYKTDVDFAKLNIPEQLDRLNEEIINQCFFEKTYSKNMETHKIKIYFCNENRFLARDLSLKTIGDVFIKEISEHDKNEFYLKAHGKYLCLGDKMMMFSDKQYCVCLSNTNLLDRIIFTDIENYLLASTENLNKKMNQYYLKSYKNKLTGTGFIYISTVLDKKCNTEIQYVSIDCENMIQVELNCVPSAPSIELLYDN